MKSIGERIRELREDNDLTQNQLAKLVGNYQNGIKRIEQGLARINAVDLPLYAKALNTSISYIVTGVNDENVTVADDLDLTDYSIEVLKKKKSEYQKRKEDPQYNGLWVNEFRLVIDVLAHNPDVTKHISDYLRSTFHSFWRNVYDPDYPGVVGETVQIDDLENFSRDDLERVKRLQITDDLKVIWENFAEERQQLIDEDFDLLCKYMNSHREEETDKENIDDECIEKKQKEMIQKIISGTLDHKEVEKNGKS